MIDSVPHWYHRIELAPGVVTPGINDTAQALTRFDLPADCAGLRVLDLGTRDGFYAFEMERRGADVVAVDYMPMESMGFKVLKDHFGSKVRFVQENVENLSPEALGTFDIVLFLGLLYHMRNPLRALDVVRSLCRDRMYLSTHLVDNAFRVEGGKFVTLASFSPELLEHPIMQFWPKDAYGNAWNGYWGPNSKCVEMMLEEANFTVLNKEVAGARGFFTCRTNDDPVIAYHHKISSGAALPE